jgi:transcriptional regulator with XRE-family HTH domain
MFFGKYLKNARLNEAKVGLRQFAKLLKVEYSLLSNIERGFEPPPRTVEFLDKLKQCLPDNYDLLLREMRKPFVMQKKGLAIPLLTPPMSEYNLKELTELLEKDAKEHNKKADLYNKEHNPKNTN